MLNSRTRSLSSSEERPSASTNPAAMVEQLLELSQLQREQNLIMEKQMKQLKEQQDQTLELISSVLRKQTAIEKRIGAVEDLIVAKRKAAVNNSSPRGVLSPLSPKLKNGTTLGVEEMVHFGGETLTVEHLRFLANCSSLDEALAQQSFDDYEEDHLAMIQNEEVVTLNVGGFIFTTTKETLCQAVGSLKDTHHYFRALFGGGFTLTKDLDGNILIDRDGTHFRYILNYLRCAGNLEECVFPWHNKNKIRELYSEALFYGLTELAQLFSGEIFHRAFEFDETFCFSNLQLLNQKKTICGKTDSVSWGTVRITSKLISKTKMLTMFNSKRANYFEIRIEETRYQLPNVFVGICNDKFNLNQEIGFDQNSYAYYCCDGQVYHENKAKKATTSTGNTKCSKGESIGVWFDVATRALYFYKNGLLVGDSSLNGASFVGIDTKCEWYFAVSVRLSKDTVSIVENAVHPDIRWQE